MKNKSEVSNNTKPSFYALIYNDLKQVAVNNGYALAIHGSLTSDMDLIAVPWTIDAKHYKTLVKELNQLLGDTVWKEHNLTNAVNQPHNRITYILSIGGGNYIDLSIIKTNIKEPFDI